MARTFVLKEPHSSLFSTAIHWIRPVGHHERPTVSRPQAWPETDGRTSPAAKANLYPRLMNCTLLTLHGDNLIESGINRQTFISLPYCPQQRNWLK